MRIRYVLAVGVALMLAGCSGERASESSDDSRGGLGDWFSRATSTGPQWSDYIPVRSGRVCTYSSSYTGEDIVGDTRTMEFEDTQTLEYADFREESDGTHFTLTSTTESTVTDAGDGETSRTPLSLPEAQTLRYVLAEDGTLGSEPALFNREGLDTGFEMSVDEFIVYPAIDALRQGQSHSASITATARATDPEAQAELEGELEPGESAMKLRLEYTVEGVPPKEITTPAGTFTDIVGVSLKYEGAEVPNANAEARGEMAGLVQLIATMAGTTTVWYARDVGVVQTETEGGMAEAMMEGTTSAQGEAASGIPPTKLEGCADDVPDSGFPQAWVGQVSDNYDTNEYDLPKTVSNFEVNTVPLSEMTGEKVGEVVGDVRYTTLDCSGVWVLGGALEDGVWVEQRIEEGLDACVEFVEITLAPPEEGMISLEYYLDDDNFWTGFLTLQGGGASNGFCESGEVQDPDCLEQRESGFEQFVGDWRVHGTQMAIRPDSTGVQTTNAGPCITSIDYEGPMCNTITQLEFSEVSSGGVVATITSVDHETWEGDPPPPGFDPDETMRVGDTFRLEFVNENLLSTTWLGRLDHLNSQGNPYWCNSETSEENTPKCGA